MLSQPTQNICITFIQHRPNVFAVGPTLHKCYTNVLPGCVCEVWKCSLDFYDFLLNNNFHQMKNYLFHIVEITELIKLIVIDRLKTHKQTFSYVACLYLWFKVFCLLGYWEKGKVIQSSMCLCVFLCYYLWLSIITYNVMQSPNWLVVK